MGVVSGPILDAWNSALFAAFMRLSSGSTFGDNLTSSDTSYPFPLWVSLMVALSVSSVCINRDAPFSVVAHCCALLRTVAHFFLLVSSISAHGSLVHTEFCVAESSAKESRASCTYVSEGVVARETGAIRRSFLLASSSARGGGWHSCISLATFSSNRAERALESWPSFTRVVARSSLR